MISIHPRGEPPCITGRVIDNSCKAHWRSFPEHVWIVSHLLLVISDLISEKYKFVSITASTQPDKSARDDITQFLQGANFYQTRVLILINAHSQIGTGHLVFEQDTGMAEGIDSVGNNRLNSHSVC